MIIKILIMIIIIILMIFIIIIGSCAMTTRGADAKDFEEVSGGTTRLTLLV